MSISGSNTNPLRPAATPQQEMARNRGLNPDAEVTAMDRNGDNRLSEEEFVRAQVQGPLARDLNGNGRLTWDEFARSRGLDPAKPPSDSQQLEELYWRAVYQRTMAGQRGGMDGEDLRRAIADRSGAGRDAFPTLSGERATFGQFAYESKAADLITRNPHLSRLMQDVQPGDLVFVQGTGIVAEATGGDWTHVALCVDKGPPPKFVESVGMTGSAESRGVTRESSFLQFISDTEVAYGGKPEFAIVRPTTDPQQIQAAIRFAREKVGTGYDFDFATGNNKYYCSELVFDAYRRNPYMREPVLALNLRETDRRDNRILDVKEFLRDRGIDEQAAGAIMAKWNGGQRLSAIGDALKLINTMSGRVSAYSYLRRLMGREPERPQGDISYHFISPSKLIEGSSERIAGRYRPS